MTEERKPTLLIVEDDELNNKLICTMVSMYPGTGYNIINVRDGVDAVRMAKEQQPDVILMDIRLNRAEMNGEEAIKVLKADPVTAHIPIITISAYALKAERERFMAAGSNEYLAKPFTSEALLPLIEKCLNQSKEQRASLGR